MEATRTLDEAGVKTGYPTKNVIASIVLATVLHVVVLGAYFILGSSKKGPAPAAAAPTAENDPAKNNAGSPKDPKALATDTKTTSNSGDIKKEKTPEEIKKSTEVAKPGEIPSKPDTDIDEILKRK